MPAKRLTDGFVKNVKLPSKHKGPPQVRYDDTLERGLMLRLVVSYGGTKSFNVLTYRHGQPKTYVLGKFPEMTVKEARAAAEKFREAPDVFKAEQLKQQGKDPSDSFKTIYENWIKRHVEAKKLINRREIERHITKYVLDKWRERRFKDIRRKHISELLDHIQDNHGPGQADAVLATIRGICNWYATRDEDYINPLPKGVSLKRNEAKARSRILTDEEIRTLWNLNGHRFGDILRLCLLTAQRREKVASMKWTDISDGVKVDIVKDGETVEMIFDGVWTVMQQDREKGTGGMLKLPQSALDAVMHQPHLHKNPYVFAGKNGSFFNDWAHAKKNADSFLKFEQPWVIHDLRRTARSLISRAGVSSEIAERVLGHVQGGVKAIYDRHSYTAEKADALDRLNKLIQSIVAPKVVPLQKGKKSLMTA